MRIGKWITASLAVLILAVMVSGCLGSRVPDVVSPTPPAVMVDYHRAGGIAGVDDRLVIFDNGAAVISTRTINFGIQVNQTELATINRLFEEADFDSLQGNYTSRHGGADLMYYSITYHSKSVVTEDTVVPAGLQPVINELNAIINTGRSQNLATGSLAGIRT
jgi:hypothetical protein